MKCKKTNKNPNYQLACLPPLISHQYQINCVPFSYFVTCDGSPFAAAWYLKQKHLSMRCFAPQLDRGHRASTWTSSSSSLCLRALYRNIPRLLHASPGQTTVTTASTEQQEGGQRGEKKKIEERRRRQNSLLKDGSHSVVKV